MGVAICKCGGTARISFGASQREVENLQDFFVVTGGFSNSRPLQRAGNELQKRLQGNNPVAYDSSAKLFIRAVEGLGKPQRLAAETYINTVEQCSQAASPANAPQ